MRSKVVDCYFKNEDEAMNALAELRKIGATQLRIESMRSEDDSIMDLPELGFDHRAMANSSPLESGTITHSRMPIYQAYSEFNRGSDAKALLSFHIDPDKLEQTMRTVIAFRGTIQ